MAKQFFLFCIGGLTICHHYISRRTVWNAIFVCYIPSFACRWYFEHVWFRLNATVACIWQINVPKMLKDTNWFRNVELTDVFITIDNLTVIFNNNIEPLTLSRPVLYLLNVAATLLVNTILQKILQQRRKFKLLFNTSKVWLLVPFT